MPKTLMSEYDLAFAPIPNESHVVLDTEPPPPALTTSALGLVFQGDRLLMPKLVERGWDIPGGHIEEGESPEESFRREVLEETGAYLRTVRPLGYQQIIIHAPKPDGYRYPHPVSYQAFFWAQIERLDPFKPTAEVEERRLFSPEQAVQLAWVKKSESLYRAALNLSIRSALESVRKGSMHVILTERSDEESAFFGNNPI